ncbi:predicted protein [Streptomyces filamentosus NRRL 15998]|uniref:Predicted protein n=1 Tax=Streptomyces filamentosus NRRL 15998 TaxID=457431 RepID=D6AU55_STRFL|nr:predicted protein [Streptomyces filamentosus NRRL 15998]
MGEECGFGLRTGDDFLALRPGQGPYHVGTGGSSGDTQPEYGLGGLRRMTGWQTVGQQFVAFAG